MEDWQRKVSEDKKRDRVSRNQSKDLLATHSAGSAGNAAAEQALKLKLLRQEQRKKQKEANEAMHKYKKNELSEDDLKLQALREEQRRNQKEASEAMHKYKKNELSEDDLKLRALRDEQRRNQQDAERAMHNYKKTELSEEDLKLLRLREEDRKQQLEAESMWREFQNNDVKAKKRAARKDVTHPPVERSNHDSDPLLNITSGSVSELASALANASPPRPLSPRTRAKRREQGMVDSSLPDYSDTYDDGDDDASEMGIVADPFDSIQAGFVSAAAASFSCSSSGLDDSFLQNSPRRWTRDQSTADHSGTGGVDDDEKDKQPATEVSESSETAPATAESQSLPLATDDSEKDSTAIDESTKDEEPSESSVAEQQQPVDETTEAEEEPSEQQPVVSPAAIEPAPVEESEKETSHQPAEEETPALVVEEEQPAPEEEPAPVVVEEPAKEPTVVAPEEPAKESAIADESAAVVEAPEISEKPKEEVPSVDVKKLAAESEAGAEKEQKKSPPRTPVAIPTAFTQPSEDSKVVKREQYIDAKSGEEKKLEVTDDILHVLDDEEETKPLVGQTSKVRLDVLFSFGLLTTSEKPTFTNYLLAVEDIVQRTLINQPTVAQHVSYDKEFGPFVQEYNKDDTYVDPKGRDHVRRVVVIAAIPVFLSNGISIRTARESICAGLQGAIVSGEFVYLAKTTFKQKKNKQKQ